MALQTCWCRHDVKDLHATATAVGLCVYNRTAVGAKAPRGMHAVASVSIGVKSQRLASALHAGALWDIMAQCCGTCRQPHPYRPVDARLADWGEVGADLRTPEHADLVHTQAARCMNCGTPSATRQTQVGGTCPGPTHREVER